jgi:GntR family transcriptional regulator
MEILIDTDSTEPIFTQLISQIKQLVNAGTLKPGFQLPSIRQLAADLGINQNTVAKAYKLLERDAVIVGKGYRGTFIHAQAKQNCLIDHSQQARQLLTTTIIQLRDLGLTDSEIRLQFAELIKEPTLTEPL